MKDSFIEKSARDRAAAILDKDTFRELIDPFERFESPHLQSQGIVPQNDDGVIIARGKLDGESAVVISVEGKFQGGTIGEVSGAKIAGSLELVLRDCENGVLTRPVLLFDTGGVRLQEANYGLLSIAEIGAAIVSLRQFVPVAGVVPGMVGSFGGMSVTAGLLDSLIVTREARIGLNGPEVIEQEAGIEEFDSKNRQVVWNAIGGIQRFHTGLADHLVQDDSLAIRNCVIGVFRKGINKKPRSVRVDFFERLLKSVDPTRHLTPAGFRKAYQKAESTYSGESVSAASAVSAKTEAKEQSFSRGRTWFDILTNTNDSSNRPASSVQCADGSLGEERIRCLSVVPDPGSPFPRARKGEIGLQEGWAIAKYVREAIDEDKQGDKRAIIAIVDIPGQAYGYNEELMGIHLACAAAADAYASARLAGHPVIALIVGNAISGGFLAHGLQANRIIALNDAGVNVHVMSKHSAARITRRTIEELEEATEQTPAMAYDIGSFAKLGAVHELIGGIDADHPDERDCQIVRDRLSAAVREIRSSSNDLKTRLSSAEALAGGRSASIRVRKLLKKQW